MLFPGIKIRSKVDLTIVSSLLTTLESLENTYASMGRNIKKGKRTLLNVENKYREKNANHLITVVHNLFVTAVWSHGGQSQHLVICPGQFSVHQRHTALTADTLLGYIYNHQIIKRVESLKREYISSYSSSVLVKSD